MLVLSFRFTGLVIDRHPKISVFFEVRAYKLGKMVNFLVDTGSKFSAITEKEAIIMGIDFPSLPYYKKEAVGFGGLFRNRIINREVILTFKSNEGEYEIKCGGGFLVICVPPNITAEEREKMIRYTPSVLGMDVLRRFKTCVSKNRVELILEKK